MRGGRAEGADPQLWETRVPSPTSRYAMQCVLCSPCHHGKLLFNRIMPVLYDAEHFACRPVIISSYISLFFRFAFYLYIIIIYNNARFNCWSQSNICQCRTLLCFSANYQAKKDAIYIFIFVCELLIPPY